MITMTIDDIARAVGVSKASVSRAITGNGRISKKTRERVLQYMTEHNFQPNVIAQSLATLKTNNIAFAVPNEHDFGEIPFFLSCLIGVCNAASKSAYDIVVVPFSNNDTTPMLRVVNNRKVDGVILSRNVDDDELLDYLDKSGIPFVLIGSTEKAGVTQLDNDHRLACRDLTSRLIAKWPGKPGLLGGSKNHVVNQNRFRGFCDALSEQGVHINTPVRWNAEDKHFTWKYFNELYDEGVRSFFCMDDIICTYLLHHLDKARSGGEDYDVKVASFYSNKNLELFYPSVPLIQFDAAAIGAGACELLIKKISGANVSSRTMLDYEIIIKEFESES